MSAQKKTHLTNAFYRLVSFYHQIRDNLQSGLQGSHLLSKYSQYNELDLLLHVSRSVDWLLIENFSLPNHAITKEYLKDFIQRGELYLKTIGHNLFYNHPLVRKRCAMNTQFSNTGYHSLPDQFGRVELLLTPSLHPYFRKVDFDYYKQKLASLKSSNHSKMCGMLKTIAGNTKQCAEYYKEYCVNILDYRKELMDLRILAAKEAIKAATEGLKVEISHSLSFPIPTITVFESNTSITKELYEAHSEVFSRVLFLNRLFKTDYEPIYAKNELILPFTFSVVWTYHRIERHIYFGDAGKSVANSDVYRRIGDLYTLLTNFRTKTCDMLRIQEFTDAGLTKFKRDDFLDYQRITFMERLLNMVNVRETLPLMKVVGFKDVKIIHK